MQFYCNNCFNRQAVYDLTLAVMIIIITIIIIMIMQKKILLYVENILTANDALFFFLFQDCVQNVLSNSTTITSKKTCLLSFFLLFFFVSFVKENALGQTQDRSAWTASVQGCRIQAAHRVSFSDLSSQELRDFTFFNFHPWMVEQQQKWGQNRDL